MGGNKLGGTVLSSIRYRPLSRTGLTPLRGAIPCEISLRRLRLRDLVTQGMSKR